MDGNHSRRLAIQDSVLDSNVALSNGSDLNGVGGAIWVNGGLTAVMLNNLSMANNSAVTGGAAFLNGAFDISVINCNFSSNTGEQELSINQNILYSACKG